MPRRKRLNLTKTYEFFLFVVAPIAVMGVVGMIWHPPVWAFFVIGIPCLYAIVRLVWPKIPRWPPRFPHLTQTLCLLIVAVLYPWIAWKAQTVQNAHETKKERDDIFAKLRFALPQTVGTDAINTAFKVINESDHEILAEPLMCGQSDSVIRFNHVVINGGSSYSDKPTTKVEKGGDVQSTTCLRPITFAIGMPDYSLLCADIRVHLNYYLADNPLIMQTKVRRFLGVLTKNSFNWEEFPVNNPESPCREARAQ